MTAKNIKPRVKIPKQVKKGQAFEVKTLVTHVMESGQRPDKDTGKKVPRDIINNFSVTYNGKTVMKADWHPGLSANPFTAFYVVAEDSGTMEFKWIDDAGTSYTKKVNVNVVAE